jgi:hypothetical protein
MDHSRRLVVWWCWCGASPFIRRASEAGDRQIIEAFPLTPFQAHTPPRPKHKAPLHTRDPHQSTSIQLHTSTQSTFSDTLLPTSFRPLIDTAAPSSPCTHHHLHRPSSHWRKPLQLPYQRATRPSLPLQKRTLMPSCELSVKLSSPECRHVGLNRTAPCLLVFGGMC